MQGVRWAGICEHGRQRYKCKECGGSSICEHGRRRYSCKECGGSGICEHGRERYRCKECGGKGICEHGRRALSVQGVQEVANVSSIKRTSHLDAYISSIQTRTRTTSTRHSTGPSLYHASNNLAKEGAEPRPRARLPATTRARPQTHRRHQRRRRERAQRRHPRRPRRLHREFPLHPTPVAHVKRGDGSVLRRDRQAPPARHPPQRRHRRTSQQPTVGVSRRIRYRQSPAKTF